MVVLISKNIPDAVRGKLKLWFIEIHPGIGEKIPGKLKSRTGG